MISSLRIFFAILLSHLVFGSGGAAAQCVNTINQSCTVYEKCFAHFCPCDGADEYFLSYGKKYCESFLSANFSGAGKTWRDKTLQCLQEKIVPHLPKTKSDQCNCAAMKSLAFKTHVECYTQPASSICKLDYSELLKIKGVVETKDILSREGRENACEIVTTCVEQTSTTVGGDGVVPDVKRHLLWVALSEICDLAVKPNDAQPSKPSPSPGPGVANPIP